jgi:hypothetical protein
LYGLAADDLRCEDPHGLRLMRNVCHADEKAMPEYMKRDVVETFFFFEVMG